MLDTPLLLSLRADKSFWTARPLYGDSGCNHKTYDVPSDISGLCSGSGTIDGNNNPNPTATSAPTTLMTRASASKSTVPSQLPSGSEGGGKGCEWEGHCNGNFEFRSTLKRMKADVIERCVVSDLRRLLRKSGLWGGWNMRGVVSI